MDGITQFQAPHPITFQGYVPQAPLPHQSPWASLVPSLLQTLVGGAIMGKIKQKLEEQTRVSEMQRQAEAEGYVPEGTQTTQQQGGGLMGNLLGAVGLGTPQAQATQTPQTPSIQQPPDQGTRVQPTMAPYLSTSPELTPPEALTDRQLERQQQPERVARQAPTEAPQQQYPQDKITIGGKTYVRNVKPPVEYPLQSGGSLAYVNGKWIAVPGSARRPTTERETFDYLVKHKGYTPTEAMSYIIDMRRKDEQAKEPTSDFGVYARGKRAELEKQGVTDPYQQDSKISEGWFERQAKLTGAKTAETEKAKKGKFDPGTVELMSESFLAGNPLPMGFGPDLRNVVYARAKELMNERGLNESDIATMAQIRKSTGSELTAIQTQRGRVMSFADTADKNLDLALSLSGKVDRTGVPVINRWLNAGRKEIAGDEDVAKFHAAVQVAVNEFAKVTSSATGGGVTSDQARKDIEGILSTALNPEQFEGVVETLKYDMTNRKKGFLTEINRSIEELDGINKMFEKKGGKPSPATTGAAKTGTEPPKAGPQGAKPAPTREVYRATMKQLNPDKSLEEIDARYDRMFGER